MSGLYDHEDLSAEELRDLLQAMPRATAPPDLEHQLMSRIAVLRRAGSSNPPEFRPRTDRVRGVLAAVSAGVILMVGWLAFRDAPEGPADIGSTTTAKATIPPAARATQQAVEPRAVVADTVTSVVRAAQEEQETGAVTGPARSSRSRRTHVESATTTESSGTHAVRQPALYGPPAPSPSPAGATVQTTSSPIEPGGMQRMPGGDTGK
jgi:hypothetical protein